MSEDRITEILSKIKNTVGVNNYKLALAITGHRPGKIRDVSMSSKDGELLLEYITQLQNNWNELKKSIENKIEELKNTIFETSLISEDIDLVLLRTRLNAYEDMLSKVQELEQGKDENKIQKLEDNNE